MNFFLSSDDYGAKSLAKRKNTVWEIEFSENLNYHFLSIMVIGYAYKENKTVKYNKSQQTQVNKIILN